MRPLLNVAPALVFLTLFATQETSAPAPVPVEQEPHHHLLLKNDSLLVLRVTLQPGERSLYHVHSVDDVAVWLGHSSAAQQLPNEPESAPVEQKPGNISLRTLHETPFTHRVHNWGRDSSMCWTWNFSSARNILPLALRGRWRAKIRAPAYTNGRSRPGVSLRCTRMSVPI